MMKWQFNPKNFRIVTLFNIAPISEARYGLYEAYNLVRELLGVRATFNKCSNQPELRNGPLGFNLCIVYMLMTSLAHRIYEMIAFFGC